MRIIVISTSYGVLLQLNETIHVKQASVMLQKHLDPDVNVGFSTMHVFLSVDIMT